MTTTPLSPTETRLLALLATERTGREIALACAEEGGGRIPYGTLYVTLDRLRAEGFVCIRPDPDDGRMRRFSITCGGTDALQEARTYYAGLAAFGVGAAMVP